jgi:hypothetical protein
MSPGVSGFIGTEIIGDCIQIYKRVLKISFFGCFELPCEKKMPRYFAGYYMSVEINNFTILSMSQRHDPNSIFATAHKIRLNRHYWA